jgi:hypothetical protein
MIKVHYEQVLMYHDENHYFVQLVYINKKPSKEPLKNFKKWHQVAF